MRRTAPALVRYLLVGIVLFGLFWGIISQLSVLAWLYSSLEPHVRQFVTIPADSLIAIVTHPLVLASAGVLVLTAAVLGYQRYGSLAGLTVALAKTADAVMGWSLFETPLLLGRVRHGDVAWRFECWEGGHVELVQRECPRCGRALVERLLRRERVHAPNTGFDPGEDTRETATETWEDVFGREKAEDHSEIRALACPTCNVSIPGTEDIPEGKDAAQAIFEYHVEQMQTGSSRGHPFEHYLNRARDRLGTDPGPTDLWDAYVAATDPPDALPFSPPLAGTDGDDPEPAGEPATAPSDETSSSGSEVSS